MSLTISPGRIVEESGSPLLTAPDSWPRRPLGSLAAILNGHAFKSRLFAAEGGLPLIRIRDIFNDYTSVTYLGEYEEKYIVQPGDLLVGMDGDFNCARWRGPESLLNQRVCKITPDPTKLDLGFLTYLLPGYLQAIHDLTSSTTVPHLSSRDIAQIPIPVPSLKEQQELAKLFDLAAAKQASAKSHLAGTRRAIERFRQSVLVAACSGRLTSDWRDLNSDDLSVDGVPARWERVGLRTLAAEGIPVSYGIVKPGPEVAGGVPYVRQQDVTDGKVLVDQLAHTSPEIAGKHRRSELHKGDVLLCIIRNLRVAIVPPGIDGANITQGMVRIRPSSAVLGEYLAMYLASPTAQKWMHDRYIGLAMPRINVEDARSIPVPLPPLDEQREIVRVASQLLTLAHAMAERVDTASVHVDRSSQAVLVKAFRGELTASVNGETSV